MLRNAYRGLASRLECSGCGYAIAAGEPYFSRCPRAREGDGVDHVLARVLSGKIDFFPPDGDSQPFVRYRHLLHVWHIARARGLADGDYVALVRELDRRLAKVAGRGLRATPCVERPALAERLSPGLAAIFVKDETGGVAACHKARHLFGSWLELEVAERDAPRGAAAAKSPAPLAIASCGNAALAAALVARAAGRRLRAFLPDWVAPEVVARLAGLEAEPVLCPRPPGALGDPAYEAFRAALADGALPFSCQGPDNALALDGGRTLAWEMVSTLASAGRRLDRLFLQTGGGALASSCIRAFEEAHAAGAPAGGLPRFHAVQTAASAPLVRAYDRVMARLFELVGAGSYEPRGRAGAAAWLAAALASGRADGAAVAGVLRGAARERAGAMWPWSEPGRSLATGILDDEAYDWWEIVRGMIRSGGFPLVVGEETLREAQDLARRTTGASPSATGAAGLAGALQLAGAEGGMAGETIAVILTGAQ